MTVIAAGPGISAQQFRTVFRHHAASVAVVTTGSPSGGGRPAGFTATSLVSVSAEPPLISFGLDLRASAWPAFSSASHVGVHLLAEDQDELATSFARSGVDRFAPPTVWHEGPHGIPVLPSSLAFLVCEVVTGVPAGDHTLFLARVLETQLRDGQRPLLYHSGRFTGLAR